MAGLTMPSESTGRSVRVGGPPHENTTSPGSRSLISSCHISRRRGLPLEVRWIVRGGQARIMTRASPPASALRIVATSSIQSPGVPSTSAASVLRAPSAPASTIALRFGMPSTEKTLASTSSTKTVRPRTFTLSPMRPSTYSSPSSISAASPVVSVPSRKRVEPPVSPL